MSKSKDFNRIMELSNTNKVIIVTNHYQIVGQVYESKDSYKNDFVTLSNASLCMINDVYETSTCDNYTSSHYDWLHINLDNIIAFSFQK